MSSSNTSLEDLEENISTNTGEAVAQDAQEGAATTSSTERTIKNKKVDPPVDPPGDPYNPSYQQEKTQELETTFPDSHQFQDNNQDVTSFQNVNDSTTNESEEKGRVELYSPNENVSNNNQQQQSRMTNQVFEPDYKDQVREITTRNTTEVEEAYMQERVQGVPKLIVGNDYNSDIALTSTVNGRRLQPGTQGSSIPSNESNSTNPIDRLLHQQDATFIAIASALRIPDDVVSEEIVHNVKRQDDGNSKGKYFSGRYTFIVIVCLIVVVLIAIVGGICGSGKCSGTKESIDPTPQIVTPSLQPMPVLTTQTIPPSLEPSVIQGQLDDFTLTRGWSVLRHARFLQDMNNDGIDDIVGFGDDGVSIALGQIDGFEEAKLALGDFGFSQGWRIEEHPRLLADVDGDGNTDVVGFFDEGVYVSRGNGEGMLSSIRLGIADFGTNFGWEVNIHPRFLADVNGDGKADFVGFGAFNVFVSLGQSDGTFSSDWSLLENYCYACTGDWRVEKHPRMIADVNGDSRADIVAFGDDGVYVALGQMNGTLADKGLVLPGVFGYIEGSFRTEKHPIFMADVNGDGRDDVVGFGNAGVFLALGQTDGTFDYRSLVLEHFGYDSSAGNWRVENHPRMLVDVNADDKADIVGFGEDGVYVALGLDDGSFNYLGKVLNDFSIDQGWFVDNNPRLLGDINGDGMLDIVGFGNDFVETAFGIPDGTFS